MLALTSEEDQARLLSRHTLTYILCLISEMLNAYDLNTLDLLIIHTIMSTNVIDILRDRNLDKEYASTSSVEPDFLKRGISRTAIARFLNMPRETVRRRVQYLLDEGIVVQKHDGIIITEENAFKFGNNPKLQKMNTMLFRRLMRDLQKAGFNIDAAS